MPLRSTVVPNVYYDSLVLMQLGSKLLKQPGVSQAVVMMGTDENRASIKDEALLTESARQATPNDLFIVVEAESQAQAQAALEFAQEQLDKGLSAGPQTAFTYKTLVGAIRNTPQANLVAVSLPGQYAAAEARRALEAGLNVFIFSDNVPVEQEIELKRLASGRRVLVMGPDCGTAIIDGAALGFANGVRRGDIGLVGAAGTGLQEVSSLIHRLGFGISQAIGTGTHDIEAKVGGYTLLGGLKWLAQDPATKVIGVISKPPSEVVMQEVERLAALSGKPVVINMLGSRSSGLHGRNMRYAATLEEAAILAVALGQRRQPGQVRTELYEEQQLVELARAEHSRLAPEQRYFRGLFSGGTLANESAVLLGKSFRRVYGNISLPGVLPLDDPFTSVEHSCVDMGEDAFTVGKPHPMLAPDLRRERLLAEAADPATGVILLDVVLGYGVHPDPAGQFAGYIEEAKWVAAEQGRHLPVVVHVCGVDEDPQVRREQVEKLRQSGALVAPTNAAATRLAMALLSGEWPQGGPIAAGLGQIREMGARLELPFDLPTPVNVINIGLAAFADSLAGQDVPVTHVEFQPPAGGDESMAQLLADML